MYDDDLEKTRALNELNVLNTNDNKKKVEFDENADTTEFNIEEKEALFNDLTREEQVINEEDSKEEKEDKDKKKKESLIDKFKKLPKKNKIIIIVGIVVILLLIIGLIIFLVTNKKSSHQGDELPSVVLAKDNYKYQDGILTILDDKDTTLGTYACDNKDENKCYVAYLNNNEDNFNVVKNVYEDGSEVKERSQAILNRYIFIFDNDSTESNKIKLYDMLNNKVLGEYIGLKQYNVETKNLAVLKNSDNKYGIIKFDESSQTNMIDFVYDYIGIIDKAKDNLIVVKNNKGYYLADYTNNLKTKAFAGEIIDYNDEYVIAKNSNDKYSVFDYNGEETNKDYDYISIINDDYLAVVKDNRVYIKDYSENKYNEEGYELTNNSYRTVYTFDNKNKLSSTTYAYTFEVQNSTLTIKLQNTDKTSREEHLNLKEGEVSAKYKYYSYFEGKLYFYDDEEKTNIVGSYECKNKNDNLSDKFNNCFVATNTSFSDNYMTPHKDNNSTLPIYNSRYAFINDASNLSSEPEIKFYDLKDNKSLGTYVAIDADVEANVSDLTYKTVSYTAIIAKLKKDNKFGVIEITSDTAQVNQNLKLEYDYIERANKDFIVKQNGKWKITYENGKYASAEFEFKIMNSANSYVVVKDGDKVFLYNGDGSEFEKVKDGFDYIDISNKYVFGAVSNNKLKVYDYTGKLLNEDSITLTSTKAFRLSATKEEVTIKTYDENNKEKQSITIKMNSNTKEDKEGEN